MGSGSCHDLARNGNGKCWTWAQVKLGWTDWQQLQQQHWEFSSQQQHWGAKNSLQMYRHHFRSKMCWNVSATSWKGFGGNPWAKPRWRAEERLQQQPAPQNLQGIPDSLAAAKGQHPWTVPEDCRALPRQAQKAISHSWTIQKQILRLKRTLAIVRQGQGPRRRKKKSILLTPNWFYDSMVRHYSTSLNDTHDLILQKFPLFLGQSPNIIF